MELETEMAKTNTLSVPQQTANILKSLFKDNSLTDVALYGTVVNCCETLQAVRAHKIVLAAGSNFFSNLFSSREFAYSNKTEYKLEKVSHESLKLIVEVLYTGEVKDCRIFDDVELACEMLASLKYLLMDDVALACENILLEHHMAVKNCMFVWKFACKYPNLPKLAIEIEKLIAKSLSELILEESFLRMTSDELCRMMLIEVVKVSTSADARFRAALAWLEHDADERKAFSNDIFAIFFLTPGKISRESLKKACYSNALVAEASTKKLLDLLACSLDVVNFAVEPDFMPQASSQAVSSNCFSNLQKVISSLYCVGGHPSENGRTFLKYNVSSKTWEDLDPLPWNRCRGGACVVDDRLVIFGGVMDNQASSVMAEYNILSEPSSSSSWHTRPALRLEAFYCWQACCVSNISAYACGPSRQLLEHTPFTSSLRENPCMLSERDGCSLVYSQMSNCVYVAGGISYTSGYPTVVQKQIDKFDVVKKKWEPIGFAAKERWHLSTTLHGDDLYLIAGTTTPGSVEKFNIRTGSRESSVPNLRHKREGCQASLLYNNVVCVFGGAVPGGGSGYKSVEAYDVREGKWSTGVVVPDMPKANAHFN